MQPMVDGDGLVYGMVAESRPMRAMVDELQLLAGSLRPVVLQGETGVGKELAARALHLMGTRREGPFIRIDCGALAETLVENELFGHARGAFTGADRSTAGAFVRATGGTLFLDEMENMSPGAQAKLLRVLSAREVLAVGADNPQPVDARVVVATNESVESLRKAGRLRADLLFRLGKCVVEVPPLRERAEDVLPLARHFLARCATQTGQPPRETTNSAEVVLLRYSWPGNVRELEESVAYGHLHARGAAALNADHLPRDVLVTPRAAPTASLPLTARSHALAREYELSQIHSAMERNGSMARAAKELGVSRVTVRRRLQGGARALSISQAGRSGRGCRPANTKILVVDDQDIVVRGIAGALRGKYEVVPARTASEALSALRQNLDLVSHCLTDWCLEDSDGLRLASLLRSEGFKRPVVLYSGLASVPNVESAKRAGIISAFWPKPFPDGHRLAEALQALR